MDPAVGDDAQSVDLRTDSHIVRARHFVRDLAVRLGYDPVTQTKLVTAASELARNTIVHGGGGRMTATEVSQGGRTGVRLEFVDDGPGIVEVEQALTQGWSSGGGMGLGLSGSRRLVHEFAIDSAPGSGTRVTVIVWRRP
ncbi:MAG: ATP-binding protein [Actinomycetes bacterium]